MIINIEGISLNIHAFRKFYDFFGQIVLVAGIVLVIDESFLPYSGV